MDKETLLPLVKSRLGITATARDEFIKSMIGGLISELDNVQGLELSSEREDHVMFVVDYACYRYLNFDGSIKMPRNLQYRLHNLAAQKAAIVDGDTSA